MDWIKVKIKHIEFDFAEAPAETFKAWIRIMGYVAVTERKPLRKHLCNRYGENNVINVENWLENHGAKLNQIVNKILEDVDSVKRRKSHDRKYMQDYRSKPLRKTLHKPLRKGQEKIREEKSKDLQVFTYLKDKSFEEMFESYISGRKNKATPHAKELILKDLHKHDLKTAISMLEQSIKNGWQGVFELKNNPKSDRRVTA